MSEPKPLTNAALASHWGTSRPYVSKLKRAIADGGKAMPEFFSTEEADTWRAVNAPAKPTQSFAQNSTESGKNIGGASGTTTRRGKNNERARAPIIDVTEIIRRGAGKDFDSLMIQQAEHVPQIAYGLYELACGRGNSAEISFANKNWHEAAKAAAAVRASFLELQEKTRALITLDEVMDIVGTEMQPARAAFRKLGERHASAANPENPELAHRVIDAAVDKVFAQLDATLARLQKELAAPAVASDPGLLPPEAVAS